MLKPCKPNFYFLRRQRYQPITAIGRHLKRTCSTDICVKKFKPSAVAACDRTVLAMVRGCYF